MLTFSENRLTEENSAPIVEIEEKTQIYHNTSLRGRTESKIRFALLVNRAVKVAKSTAHPSPAIWPYERNWGNQAGFLRSGDLRAGVDLELDALLQNPCVPSMGVTFWFRNWSRISVAPWPWWFCDPSLTTQYVRFGLWSQFGRRSPSAHSEVPFPGRLAESFAEDA